MFVLVRKHPVEAGEIDEVTRKLKIINIKSARFRH
jgi:hypothetical protein